MRTNWMLPENEERLRKAVADSISLAATCEKLGLAPLGGNYSTLKRHIARLSIDVSHHEGQAWNRGKFSYGPLKSMTHLRRRLIRERGHRCESCGLDNWLGQPIPLEMDHISGDRSDNSDSNLRLLCCNCHALTPTWRRQKV